MAFRADISIDWATSPRIVTVAAPSTEVSLQDLVDTLRTHEAYLDALDDKKILDAIGKTQLGPGKFSSITVTLRDALLAFEARPPGPWVLCMVTGGNLVAKDINGVPLPSAMQPTAYTYPIVALSTDGSLLAGSGGATPEQVATAVLEAPVAGRPPGSLGATVEQTDLDVLDVSAEVTGVGAQVTGVGGQVSGVADQVDDVADQVTGVGVQVSDVADRVEDIIDTTDDLHDEALGRWVLNPAAQTLTLYRADGSVLRVFNLTLAAADVPPYIARTPA